MVASKYNPSKEKISCSFKNIYLVVSFKFKIKVKRYTYFFADFAEVNTKHDGSTVRHSL